MLGYETMNTIYAILFFVFLALCAYAGIRIGNYIGPRLHHYLDKTRMKSHIASQQYAEALYEECMQDELNRQAKEAAKRMRKA